MQAQPKTIAEELELQKDFLSEIDRRMRYTPDIDELYTYDKHLIFVYCNLMSGHINHNVYLSGCDYLGRANTLEPNYALRRTSTFPIMCKHETEESQNSRDMMVYGETYGVSPSRIIAMDQLLKNGELFNRQKIFIRFWDQDTPFKDKSKSLVRECWAYLANPKVWDEKHFSYADRLGFMNKTYWKWMPNATIVH